jgi:hypothetical protein
LPPLIASKKCAFQSLVKVKEKIMDRNFYQQKLAEEHQREISRELANRNLLKEAGLNIFRITKPKRMIFQLAPTIIILSLLLFYFLR